MKKKKSNKKPIYQVFCTTSYGFGMQPVKANNKKEAREKFKKRYKKSKVVSIEKADADYKPLSQPI